MSKIIAINNFSQFMKGAQLGEFEELVLLTIAMLYNDAYSAAVVEELGQRLNRPMSLGAVHRTMQRLEEKGLVQSQFGQATAERGGRRKRLYTVTSAGEQTLQQVRQIRNELWEGIPQGAFGMV
jgi:PadR family transcriptional regulator PadR